MIISLQNVFEKYWNYYDVVSSFSTVITLHYSIKVVFAVVDYLDIHYSATLNISEVENSMICSDGCLCGAFWILLSLIFGFCCLHEIKSKFTKNLTRSSIATSLFACLFCLFLKRHPSVCRQDIGPIGQDRNWKGIGISLLVILVVLSLIGMSIVLLSKGENQQHRHPLVLVVDILSHLWINAAHKGQSWLLPH